ncbi:hypothetical protein C1645_802989 [Glomus cerebriforme]|uniref:Ras guanine nucleotide exchange factor domain-containing protein n=1 Tax=Glomus cerebriforme TaxID=658196 RepID=A0A397TG93_9GLOM|nr:hypothetical protein C1645_802989 [Glomus cerebriforme]
MFKRKAKKSGEEQKNQSPKQSGNSNESSNRQLAIVHNKTTATINFILNKAPGLLPAVVNTAKSITPKLPSKKHDKNRNRNINKDENIGQSNLPSQGSPSPPFTSPILTPHTRSGSRSLNEIETGEGDHVSDHQRRPSEPTPVRGNFPPGILSHNNYNRNGNVPAINIHNVDEGMISPIDHSPNLISNVNVIKEGYLKKIDFDSKPSLTSRGWKVYKVNLRGSKLYFYKPPSEAVLKTFFPNNKDIPIGKDYSTLSPVVANDRGIHLNPSNFESNAAKLIFEGGANSSFNGEIQFIPPLIKKYYYGETGYEVDRSVVMRFKKLICLLIFEDHVVICKRKFIRYTSNLRLFGGGNHSSTNVPPSNTGTEFGGQDIDARSVSSTRGIPDNDGTTTNKGKGYFTKWKLDAYYPIHSIEIIDPNFQTTYSPYIVPSTQPYSTNRVNDPETSSLHSVSSSISVAANVNSSSGAILYLNITDGRDKDSYRVFVVPNNEIRSLWEAKLFDAKKKSLRKIMIQHGGADINNPVGSHDQNSSNGLGGDKPESGSSSLRKARVYWGTNKHPELIIKEIKPDQNSEHDNVSATTSPVSPSPPSVESSSQRLIRGGLIDSLVHELIFETQKGPNDDNDDFLHAFLLTYPLFADPSHIFRELRRCGNMQSSERKKSNAIIKRLFTILSAWCKNHGHDLSRDEVYNGMIETLEEVLGIAEDEEIAEGEELKKLIQENRKNIQNVSDDNKEEQLTSLQGPPAPLSLDLSNLLVTGLTPALFLKMEPKELAQQLYIYHFLELKKTNPGKNLKRFIPSKYRPESLTSPLNDTPTTPHFITRLIYHHILILTQQSAYTSRRPLLLTHWIKTGIACKTLGDMTGWMAVALAICSPAIVRLKETWRRVNKQWIDVVVDDWVPLLIKCGGIDGEIDIENFKSLLLVIYDRKEKSKTKPIPYFGFITLALERLNSTIPSVIDRSTNDTTRVGSRNNSITGNGVVNFEKYWKMYDTIIESLAQWQQTGNFNDNSGDTCPFSPSSPLQKFFHQFNSVPASSALDTWQLFDSSLSCEPRLHGQYLEHHARQRKSHSAYVPLVFTEVIPTNRLFEKNAYLSASGALGKRASNSSLNLGDNNPTVSSGRPIISGPTPLNLDALPASNSTKSKPNSPNHLSVQRGVRKRTLSFPPARIGPLTSTTWNTGLDLVTRNWLGGLVQHRGGYTVLLKCMKDIAGVGEMLMFVKDGELVFKSVRDATGSRPASLVENSSGTSSKRNSIHGLVALTQQQNSPRTSIYNSDHDALMVVVKAGTLERLVDVLINGVASYSTSVVDDNGEPPLTIGKQGQLGINSEEYLATFFSTYRSFCSPILLLDILRKRFINAKKVSKDDVESRNQMEAQLSPTRDDDVNYDWNMVSTIQSKVLKVFYYWVKEFFHDFLDDLTLKNRLMHFIDEAKDEVESWSKIIREEPLVVLAEDVKSSLNSLRCLAAKKSLEPTYDFQDETMASLVDKVMNDSYQLSSSDNDNKQIKNDDDIVIPSIDNNEVCDLLDSIDLTVLRLFETVTPQDWILAYEILETQSADILGWYPKKQSPSSDDEIIITDIFITMQQTERVSNSKEYVLDSLPRSIKALCRMHKIIRNWIIQEITSPSVDSDKRVNRINKLLDMILLSRKRMVKLDIYPRDEAAKQDFESKRGVPSFIESSIVSGLISPESRFFTRAWNDVAQNRNSGLDTLDSLLQGESSKPVKDSHPNFALVPCIGWLFERMLEICCNVPDMSFESEKLINYDKRRYVYNLTQIFVRLQHELTERSQEIVPSIDVRFLTNANSYNNTSKSDLRNIKDFAIRENSTVRITNTQSKYVKSQKPFNKLVAEQQEKIKRDQKERDRLAKDIRETQNKLQKKSRTNHRPSRVESFIKQVARPLSIAFGSSWQSHNSGNSPNLKNLSGQYHSSSSKAALVINLINSNASEASSDFGLTLDSVFRIVTEEGGQYLFQALDNDNMNDWIRVINEAAKEGAEKRNTILNKEPDIVPKEEEVPDDPPKTRGSVYGKDLITLMPDGKIPIFVEKCITEIEKRGLREVGIYRIPGAANAVNKLRAAFNKNADAVDLSDEEYRDINVVAGALKRFFRDLPEPIMTYELYDDFIEANGLQDRDEKLYAIKDLLYKLPIPNYELLKRLIEHLERVTDFEEINHMYANNLAIVFGPNLLKTRDFARSMSNLGHHNSIVRSLILQYHWFFNIEEEEEASEIEYQDDLLDPDMETSEPEGENEDRPIQENTIVTDDDVSFEISSENEPINGPNYDELNNLTNEIVRHSWEGPDGEIIEEYEENLQENLQESIEELSNIDSIVLEQHKHDYIEDIGNRDSTLTDVTEDPEEVKETTSIVELEKNEQQNATEIVSENTSMMEPVKNELQNATEEVSENTSMVEPVKNATEIENESVVESVNNEEQEEQDNGTLHNSNVTGELSTFVRIPKTNLTEKFVEKSRYSVNLIDFDSDFEALPQQFNILNTANEHLMDNIDNYIEYESTLDKPLQPGKYVQQKTKRDSTIEQLDKSVVNDELNSMQNTISSLNSLLVLSDDDMNELISKRKSIIYEPKITKQVNQDVIDQQENVEIRPFVENAESSKDYNNEPEINVEHHRKKI